MRDFEFNNLLKTVEARLWESIRFKNSTLKKVTNLKTNYQCGSGEGGGGDSHIKETGEKVVHFRNI